jgi:hypothetical protein
MHSVGKDLELILDYRPSRPHRRRSWLGRLVDERGSFAVARLGVATGGIGVPAVAIVACAFILHDIDGRGDTIPEASQRCSQ